MKILFLASEVLPYSKTGGLADVAGALPKALRALGHEVSVVTPFYAGIDPGLYSLARRLRTIEVPLGNHLEPVGLYEGKLGESGARIYFLDHKTAFDRPHLYGDANGDYPDNAARFSLLSAGGLEVARALGLRPDIVHANDWQTALACWYLRNQYRDDAALARARSVLTIHNLAFQGNFDRGVVDELDLGWADFTVTGFEFWGKVSFLKAGLVAADALTTVSPRYAREIQEPDQGFGLDGLLRARAKDLTGIINGVDYTNWSPAVDRLIAARYTPSDLDGKRACKTTLQKHFQLPLRPRTPLFGSVSRLTAQKGFDLVTELATELGSLDLQYVLLGEGEPEIAEALRDLARRYPDKLAVKIGYDEALAHQIQAGADFFVMPSRYEPCGVNQLYALRYGTLPIVHTIGGLDDTIVDIDPRSVTGNGFKFAGFDAAALLNAIRRALACYADTATHGKLLRRAMEQDFGWVSSAKQYETVYRRLIAEAASRTRLG